MLNRPLNATCVALRSTSVATRHSPNKLGLCSRCSVSCPSGEPAHARDSSSLGLALLSLTRSLRQEFGEVGIRAPGGSVQQALAEQGIGLWSSFVATRQSWLSPSSDATRPSPSKLGWRSLLPRLMRASLCARCSKSCKKGYNVTTFSKRFLYLCIVIYNK